MSDNELDKNLMADHDYDGIQELDNPLPKWWLFTFYITIVFSAFYIPYYHFFGGQSPSDEFKAAMVEIEAKRAAAPKDETPAEAMAAALTDAQIAAKGKDVYVAKCAACHGAEGQGVIGPNLTDEYWLNGDGTPKSLVEIIRDGVPAKGMPPWGPVITPDELKQVSAYVLSLQGTKPANPKAPQGAVRKTAQKQ
ncbi:MAG TPA: cbb3-type cytochrome c oxidase N-terminal domain-containing protein [Bdellovibrionales bacterium]|nr:cbb3-type cytochrome c oxidase N-terminal domain-containing protein [Bdellovibrionales bacterium]